ncbi:PEP-CTERM sorting domain-containing protein [Cerasicoccus arenae]|uniref:PEP-CTERM protein-sorting domain-containing protein n=1 Tax=Cerasicoccus arenae TaxID=424488 RepID=A0A8J3DF48_9BACT|nr:PEP-CTERM sorting domain-containing protein [Cerasicoccus arenae]MBK1859750.1 PEP-CTERM sorting domain-containing protein [Cerasicoccus arenae]GHB93599.1 hypothetical protein GCM10007047_06360 [Cerasicoccus arenae]
MPNKLINLAALAVFAVSLPTTASAVNIVWNGLAGDDLYATDGNWVGGVAPSNNDYADTAVFNSTATPSEITYGSRKVAHLLFETAGWTLSGGHFNGLGSFESHGAGTNSIIQGASGSAFTVNQNYNPTWTIGDGNTLFVSGYYQNSKIVTLTGGGTLSLGSAVSGFGSLGFILEDVTVRTSVSQIFSASGGTTTLTNIASAVQLQTTIAAAEAMIGSKILDGLGNGLEVTDIGGGYVEVSPTSIPEPSMIALMFGVTVLGVTLTRRRLSCRR